MPLKSYEDLLKIRLCPCSICRKKIEAKDAKTVEIEGIGKVEVCKHHNVEPQQGEEA